MIAPTHPRPGFAGDNSLDGYFGRSTAIGALSFPPLNPYIRLRPVETEES